MQTRNPVALLALSLCFTASHASAQSEQTPQAAQQFLEVTSSKFTILFADGRYGFNPRSPWIRFHPSTSGDVCQTNRSIQYLAEPAVLDWEHVASVRRDIFDISITYSSGSTSIYRYPSEDLAKRAAFAMEFLRISCDPTRDLAF